MKKLTLHIWMTLLVVGMVAACDVFEVDEVIDPNNPSQDAILANASEGQLQNLVTGLEFRNRSYVATPTTGNGGAVTFMGAFGREVLPLFASDPRFISQWMGTSGSANAETDPSFFQYGVVYNSAYDAIKQANFLIQAVENSTDVTDEQKNGYLGYAKTIQAFQYLLPWLSQFDNGIRLDVADPLNPGEFVSFEDAGPALLALLDEAQTDLNNAGTSFNFELQTGFEDFENPAAFSQLNRAIKARTAIYLEEWDTVLESLEDAQPFFELAEGQEAMNKGAYHNFGAPPDIFNPFFFPRNAATSQIPMVHPAMVEEAEEGDLRAELKFFERNNPVSFSGFSSGYQDNRFVSNTEPVTFLRNEELILLYAEALAQRNEGTDLAEAVDAINLVRNTWDLDDFESLDQQEIIDQVLFERRYSLWFEFGHQWLDARRYDRLDELLEIDTTYFPNISTQIYTKVARPLSESQWDEFSGNN